MFLPFLERGHTENAADEVHSTIERAKNVSIFHPSEWAVLIRNIETKSLEMKVRKMNHEMFLDTMEYSKAFPNYYKNKDGEKVMNWMKVKILIVKKAEPYKIFFKMNSNDDDFSCIYMLQRGGKRKISRDHSVIPSQMKKAYSKRHPISEEKFEDLKWMCDSMIVPEEYHDFYKNLPQ